MKKTKLLLTLLYLWVGMVPALAQSVTIIRDMKEVPMASVLAMYKNEFGSFEKPALSDPFPFALIRMHLEGNAHDVRAAKERLTLYMGQQTGVEARVTTYSNQILFLVPARRPMIFIDCGDGCEQVMLSNMQKLRSNSVYDCTVRFRTERSADATVDTVFVNEGPKIHELRLQVEPADAKVEVIAHGEEKKWVLTDGIADLQLTEGEYRYMISAENYHTAQGTIQVPTNEKIVYIPLRPMFGWMRISSDSMNLQGLSAKIQYGRKKETVVLPHENTKYEPGTYIISIDKVYKHHPYKKSITIEEGKLTTVCPVLVPKVYKRNTFVLAEAGYAINPSWGVGLMVGQVYGEVTKGCGIGWYVQGRSNFQMVKALPNILIDENGMIEGKTPFYTGEQCTNEFLFNAGLVLNFLNKQKPNRSKNSMFGLYAGLGYGQYARSWEISDGRWIEYAPSKAKGLNFGGGLIGSIKGFTINVGINTIQAKYVEVEAGLGWTF